jgi:hypothetical protein
MSTYTVVVPADQTTLREFTNLREAKRYLKQLPRGYTNAAGILLDGFTE